jgi:soluble lytic murein transglycosylase-like protein
MLTIHEFKFRVTTSLVLICVGIIFLTVDFKTSAAGRVEVQTSPGKIIIYLDEYKVLKEQYPWLTKDLYSHIRRVGHQNNIDPQLIVSLIEEESSGHWWARGKLIYITDFVTKKQIPQRARGYMQVLPIHYPGPADDLLQPQLNIKMGTAYLRYCLNISNGNIKVALAGYNAGPNRPYYESDYVRKIVARYETTSKKSKVIL